MESDKIKVLVTGVTGFLGSRIANSLLEQNYLVRGTVWSLKNKDKLYPINSLPHQENLELIEADLLKEEDWDKAVSGCKYVLHVASPFPTKSPKNENDLINPAVKGTTSILKAVSNHKEIKHVVITSSIAAIMHTYHNHKKEYDENDWPDIKYIIPYNKSKTLAEKSAWDFYNKLKQENKLTFKLTTICPGYIFGPSLIKTDFSSGSIIKQIMMGELLGIPKLYMPIVDVRDVAIAHIKAMESDITDGNRYICTSDDGFWASDISNLIKKEYGKFGYKPTTLNVPYFACWAASWLDGQAASACSMWGCDGKFKNDKIKKDLGLTFISGKEAILKMIESLIEFGIIPNLIKK